MHTVATTWDAIELWLVGLPFAPQVAIVMVVVLPLCVLAARLLDRVVGAVSAWAGPHLRPRPAPSAKATDRAD